MYCKLLHCITGVNKNMAAKKSEKHKLVKCLLKQET